MVSITLCLGNAFHDRNFEILADGFKPRFLVAFVFCSTRRGLEPSIPRCVATTSLLSHGRSPHYVLDFLHIIMPNKRTAWRFICFVPGMFITIPGRGRKICIPWLFPKIF